MKFRILPILLLALTSLFVSQKITAQSVGATFGNFTAMTATYATVSSPAQRSNTVGVLDLDPFSTITITAPANFEVATLAGGPYSSSFTATCDVNGAASIPVYVRMLITNNVGTYSGNVVVTNNSVAPNDAPPLNISINLCTVNKRTLTIAGTTIAPKIYDGTATAGTISYGALSNFANSTIYGVTFNETVVVSSASATDYSNGLVANGKATTVTYTLGNGTGGGLASNYQISPVAATGDITPKALTISGLAAANKVYDGNTTATVSGSPTLNGVIAGDVGNVTLGGGTTPTFATATVGNNKPVSFGTPYSISGSASGNYTLTPPGGVTAHILPKTLLTATPPTIASRVYNGTKTAGAVTVGVLSGFIPGETVTATGVGSDYATEHVGTGKLTDVHYTLHDGTGGGLAANYELADYIGATGDVTVKTLTVSGHTANNKVYDGNTTATLAGTAVLTGVVGVEDVTVSGGTPATFDTKDAGNGKTVTRAAYTLGGTATLSNYSLVQPAALTANITKKGLSITAPSIAARQYNGTLTAGAVTIGTLSGFVGLETVTATGAASDYASQHVGNGKATTVSYTLADGTNGGLAANYSLADDAATGDVTPKTLTITAPSLATRGFDGTTNPGTLTIGTLSGFVGVETVTATGSAANYSSANIGTYSSVITYLLADGTNGGLATNYALANGSANGTISGISVTITGVTADNKVYDGTTAATLTGTATMNGILPADLGNVTLGGGGSATFSDKNVANGKTVTVANYTLSGSAAGNYTITQPAALTANITPKALTITPASIASKVYNGTATVGTITVGTISGFVGTETVTASAAGTDYSTANAGGPYNSNITYTLADGTNGGLAINYSLAGEVATGSITPKPLTITGISINNKLFDGNTSATIAGTPALSGVVPADLANVTLGGTGTATFASSAVANGISVTVTGYSISGSASTNYSLTQPAGLTANITNSSVSIGDKVWEDTDGNGQQDVGEPGIAGITVQLYQAATLLATATTDVNGNYLFSSDPAGTTTASSIYNIAGLTASTLFTVRVPNVIGGSKQVALGTNELTVVNTGADASDSDGAASGNDADAAVTTGALGSSDITIDFGFAPAGVGGGGGGGLESRSLGDAVAKRIFNKAVNNENGPVNYNLLPQVQFRSVQNRVQGTEPSKISLTSIMPDITSKGYVAYNSSPKDLTSITNAKEVLAFDFTSNKEVRAVAFATKTLGELYDHTKPICDRLKGATLVNVETVKVQGYDFVKYTINNENGQREYATSFTVGTKAGRPDFSLQSIYLTQDYANDETMYNFQLWASSPVLVTDMITDVLNKLKANAPVNVIKTSAIPATYVESGKREGQNINLVVKNATPNTSGYFKLEDKASETSASSVVRNIPFTINANGKSNVIIPMDDKYESTLTMYVGGEVKDVVYMSDGAWTVDYNKSTTVLSSFKIVNDSKRAYTADEYPLFRNVELKANSSDFVSVVKLLRGGGAAADLNAFKGLKFSASGGYNLHVTLIKNGIVDYRSQYAADVQLELGQQDYYIALDKFTSASNSAKIDPKDITSIVFTVEVGTGRNSPISTTLSNVAFTKEDLNYLSSLEAKELAVYPNPVSGNRITVNFSSAKAAELSLRVTDMSGKVITLRQVQAVKGMNTVQVPVSTGLKAVHIVSLDGADIKYKSTKVMITN
jgi:hypothetical protein